MKIDNLQVLKQTAFSMGSLTLSQAEPFLKIVEHQVGIKLSRARYLNIARSIVEQSTRLN